MRGPTDVDAKAPPPGDPPALARTMGLFALTLYGVGDMLGAGIYGLIGRAAGVMGNTVWLAFGVSLLAALSTGLSYASLGSRYPRAAGGAYIAQRAYGRRWLSYAVGLAAMASGLTSMAAASRVFAGYFQVFVSGVPTQVIVIGFLLALTAVNLRGMRESMWMNALCTIAEVGGLVLVIVVGAKFWGTVDYLDARSIAHPERRIRIPTLLTGAVLTFYSFIGFEDVLNVAEEVREPRRTLPLGLLFAVVITSAVYMAIGITAVSVVPHAELARSDQPLVTVVTRAAPWVPARLYSSIALFAVANTALLNFVMGSRLAYGMARQGLLPRVLGKVHPTRRTPHVAILTLLAIVLVLALVGDISVLARATSVLLLLVFTVVNGALVVLKRRADEPKGGFEVPLVVPIIGVLVCVTMILSAERGELTIAGAILAAIAILYLVLAPKRTPETIDEAPP